MTNPKTKTKAETSGLNTSDNDELLLMFTIQWWEKDVCVVHCRTARDYKSPRPCSFEQKKFNPKHPHLQVRNPNSKENQHGKVWEVSSKFPRCSKGM